MKFVILNNLHYLYVIEIMQSNNKYTLKCEPISLVLCCLFFHFTLLNDKFILLSRDLGSRSIISRLQLF